MTDIVNDEPEKVMLVLDHVTDLRTMVEELQSTIGEMVGKDLWNMYY
jgi:hypothetical protein